MCSQLYQVWMFQSYRTFKSTCCTVHVLGWSGKSSSPHVEAYECVSISISISMYATSIEQYLSGPWLSQTSCKFYWYVRHRCSEGEVRRIEDVEHLKFVNLKMVSLCGVGTHWHTVLFVLTLLLQYQVQHPELRSRIRSDHRFTIESHSIAALLVIRITCGPIDFA